MNVIRYDKREAYEYGIRGHPQDIINEFGMEILKWEEIEIADCIMIEVDNIPAFLPIYIEISNYKME